MDLTPQQADGIEKVKAWFPMSGQASFSEPFRWFGYAGTGKTFSAARIPEALGLTNVVYGTYTGKAASVLRKSLARYGVTAPVTTIHSAIYRPTTSAAAREALDAAREELKELEDVKAVLDKMPDGDPRQVEYLIEGGWADRLEFAGALSEVSESIPRLEADARRLRFEFNPESEWAYADLIILDEVSMVNAKLAADIESFGVPILVLGDPAQLPPVEGGGYYTDAQPDHLLTDIQRAALDSPVTVLATRIRQSQDGCFGLVAADRRNPSLADAMAADVVLCWTNRQRWTMINAIRKRLDRQPGVPAAGDTVMVLTNNKDAAVFNGELFDVLAAQSQESGGWVLTVRTDTGLERELQVYAEGFRGMDEQKRAKSAGLGLKGQRALATFGQCITVHKAQGSEWPHVYVINETRRMLESMANRKLRETVLGEARAWLYTAATRASETITITHPR